MPFRIRRLAGVMALVLMTAGMLPAAQAEDIGIAPLLHDARDYQLPDGADIMPDTAGRALFAPPLPAEGETAREPAAPLAPPQDIAGPLTPGDGGGRAPDRGYRTFGSQLGAVKWEMAALLGYYTAINGSKLFEDPQWPHFHDEGWFQRSTANVGVDKLAHAYSTYVISELLYARLKYKTGGAPNIAATAAALGAATMLYTELWDSIEPSSGWSWQDVSFNMLGAGLSILRNSVPGLDRKLDYRLMIVPNDTIFTAEGKRHFEQQRYFLALKLSGFRAFEQGPLRLVELHAGYYGKDFSLEDRAMGIQPKRRIFFGM